VQGRQEINCGKRFWRGSLQKGTRRNLSCPSTLFSSIEDRVETLQLFGSGYSLVGISAISVNIGRRDYAGSAIHGEMFISHLTRRQKSTITDVVAAEREEWKEEEEDKEEEDDAYGGRQQQQQQQQQQQWQRHNMSHFLFRNLTSYYNSRQSACSSMTIFGGAKLLFYNNLSFPKKARRHFSC
jgi:hypothetical protein